MIKWNRNDSKTQRSIEIYDFQIWFLYFWCENQVVDVPFRLWGRGGGFNERQTASDLKARLRFFFSCQFDVFCSFCSFVMTWWSFFLFCPWWNTTFQQFLILSPFPFQSSFSLVLLHERLLWSFVLLCAFLSKERVRSSTIQTTNSMMSAALCHMWSLGSCILINIVLVRLQVSASTCFLWIFEGLAEKNARRAPRRLGFFCF